MQQNLGEHLSKMGIRSCLACSGGVVFRGNETLNLSRISITTWHVSPAHFWYEVGQIANIRGNSSLSNCKDVLVSNRHIYSQWL